MPSAEETAEALRLPDRSHFGPGLRGAFFLFRQPFVLWPGTAAWIALLGLIAATSIGNPRATFETVATLVAITPLVALGFAVLTGLMGFMLYRAIAAKGPALELETGEEVLEERRANHFLGDEARGGRLHLTRRRVVFLPHRFNVQLAPRSVLLREVRSARWARILGPTGLPISSVLELETGGGKETFVVDRAGVLAGKIEDLARAAW